MGNEYPSIPAHFLRMFEWLPIDDSDIEEIWQSLCDTYGQTYAGQFTIEINCKDDRDNEEDD